MKDIYTCSCTCHEWFQKKFAVSYRELSLSSIVNGIERVTVDWEKKITVRWM